MNITYTSKDYPLDLYLKFEEIPKDILAEMSEQISSALIESMSLHAYDNINILIQGIGNGRIELPLLERMHQKLPDVKFNIQAYDISQVMLTDFRKRLNNYNFSGNFNIHQKSIENIFNKGQKFDIIFSLFSFHFLKHKYYKLVDCLQKWGVIIVAEETGGFLAVENKDLVKDHRIRNYQQVSKSEYVKFWQYFHKKAKIHSIYSTDISYFIDTSYNNLIDTDLKWSWSLSNLTYADIKAFISGDQKVYGYFDYKEGMNQEIVDEWMEHMYKTPKDTIDRIEGHEIFLVRHPHYLNLKNNFPATPFKKEIIDDASTEDGREELLLKIQEHFYDLVSRELKNVIDSINIGVVSIDKDYPVFCKKFHPNSSDVQSYIKSIDPKQFEKAVKSFFKKEKIRDNGMTINRQKLEKYLDLNIGNEFKRYLAEINQFNPVNYLHIHSIGNNENFTGVLLIKAHREFTDEEIRFINSLIKRILLDPLLYALKNDAKRQIEDLKDVSTLNARSQIITRNLSHNIGSHVLNNLSNMNTFMEEVNNSLEFKSANPKVKQNHFTRFLDFLKKRMTFIADISGDAYPVFSSVKIADALEYYTNDNSQENKSFNTEKEKIEHERKHLNFIKKYLVKDIVPYIKLLKEDYEKDYYITISNDTLGYQGFYIIIENFIRNSYKYTRQSSKPIYKNTPKTIRGIYKPNPIDNGKARKSYHTFVQISEFENLNEKISRFERNHYIIDIIDYCGQENHKDRLEKSKDGKSYQVLKTLKKLLSDTILQPDSFNVRAGGWGLLEMKICAASLLNLKLKRLDDNLPYAPLLEAGYYKYGFKNGRESFKRLTTKGKGLLTKEQEKEFENFNLGFRFYVHKIKLAYIYLDKDLEEETFITSEKIQQLNSLGVAIGGLDMKRAFKYDFFIAKRTPEIEENIDPNQRNILLDKQVDIYNIISWINMYDRILDVETMLYKHLYKEPSKTYDHVLREYVQDNLKNSNQKREEKWTARFEKLIVEHGKTFKEKVLYCSHAHYNAFKNTINKPRQKPLFYENYRSQTATDKLISSLCGKYDTLLNIKLYESGASKILILDERLQRAIKTIGDKGQKYNELIAANIFIPKENETQQIKDTAIELNLSIINDLSNSDLILFKQAIITYIHEMHKREQLDYVIIHFSLIEKVLKSGVNEIAIDNCLKEIQKDFDYKIVLISGRSDPIIRPYGTYFIHFDSIDHYVFQAHGVTKYGLFNLLKNARKKIQA